MKITTLIEDTKYSENMRNEMGLSLFIETDQSRILLDTGRTGLFAENARQFDIALDNLDACVISHAHYDHGGGLEDFFALNNTAPVFMHQKAAGDYFKNRSKDNAQVLSKTASSFIRNNPDVLKPIDLDKDLLKKNKNQIHYVTQPIKIGDDAWLITDIRQHHLTPASNKFLLETGNGLLQEDTFRHEIILAFKTPQGIVLFSGCCHNGILNMIDAVLDYFDNAPIKAIVGGFHLARQPGKDPMSCTPAQIKTIAETFLKNKIDRIFTGHCTGQEAFDALYVHLGSRLGRLSTGAVFTI